MKKDCINFVDNVLTNYNVEDDGDVFVHGFVDDKKISPEEKIQSIFASGLKKAQPYASILSTAKLCDKSNPTSEEIINFNRRGSYRVIVHIPKTLDNILFENCDKLFDDRGLQYENHCLFDYLQMDAIPSEFIVGVYYDDADEYYLNNNINCKFIENPNYYAHKKNGKQNTENLIKKIRERLDKLSTLNRIMSLDYDITTSFVETLKKLKDYDRMKKALEKRNSYDLDQLLSLDF